MSTWTAEPQVPPALRAPIKGGRRSRDRNPGGIWLSPKRQRCFRWVIVTQKPALSNKTKRAARRCLAAPP